MTLHSIYLTCKYFYWILENTSFWKLRLKQSKSWKDLCKRHMTIDNVEFDLENFFYLSGTSLKRHLNESPITQYIYEMCQKVSKMGYFGIYFWCRLIDNDVLQIKDWGYKYTKLRHFDFHRDNYNDKHFNTRKVLNKFLNFRFRQTSDFEYVLSHIRTKKINFEVYMSDRKEMRFVISWEHCKKKRKYCSIL